MLDEDFALSYAARKLGRELGDEEKSLVLALSDRREIREWAFRVRSSTLQVEAMPKVNKKEVIKDVAKDSEEDEQAEQSKPNKGIKKKKHTSAGKSNSEESSSSN